MTASGAIPESAEESIHGVGPLPADSTRRSGFHVALSQAMWYVSDGRPYDELMAASGAAFAFSAREGSPPTDWGAALEDRRIELLARATGIGLRYVELASAALAERSPREAWSLIGGEVQEALSESRPPLARGGWPGAARRRWGVITGLAASGLPTGHVYLPPGEGAARLLAMDGPPWQLVILGLDRARPPARPLTAEVLRQAAGELEGEPEVIRLGEGWRTGAMALELWADRLGSADEAVHRRLAADLRDRRRWAVRYLEGTAGLRLGQVRGCRELARELGAASAFLDDLAALEGLGPRLRELATRERALAVSLRALAGR